MTLSQSLSGSNGVPIQRASYMVSVEEVLEKTQTGQALSEALKAPGTRL
jgi:hypothetical protein